MKCITICVIAFEVTQAMVFICDQRRRGLSWGGEGAWTTSQVQISESSVWTNEKA